MAITNAFREAVAKSDINSIRIMMKDSLLVDPSFHEFEEMKRLSKDVSGLYDEDDGHESQREDPSAWDDAYMNKMMVQVVNNFSPERLQHLQDIVRRLRPVPQRPQSSHVAAPRKSASHQASAEHRKKSTYQEQRERDKQKGAYRGTKMAGGAVIGAIVGGVAASVASFTVVGGAVAGAVAGGVLVGLATNGE